MKNNNDFQSRIFGGNLFTGEINNLLSSPDFLKEDTIAFPIIFALLSESDSANTDGPDPEIPHPMAPESIADFRIES